MCKLNQDTVNVIGFLGLVGKEPDVARGLLVDTGASINVHGQSLVNIPITFTSQKIQGNAPALLGLPALIQMGAIINTRTHSMTLEFEGEDVVVPLIHTRSGHYVLPLDAFDEAVYNNKSY